MRRLGGLVTAALVIGSLVGGPGYAQDLSPTERAQLQAKKEQLFQQSLRDPGNLDITFAYADAAAKLGDNEAAVSALERMLLFNPNLPRVQLELGALYFRMGSYESARTYFDRAAAANPPADVQERIQTYLAEISRRSAPQRFSGYAFFGAQYQTDANVAGSSSIAFPGVVINLLPQFKKRDDYDVFATGSVLYSYDLGNQSADAVEVVGTTYFNHYGLTRRLNLGLIEITAGPRFNFREPLPGVSSASLKPYVIGNEVTLGDHQYFDTWGVGGESTALAWEDLRFKSTVEYRNKTFTNAPDRPLSNGFNGSDKLVTVSLNKPISVAPDSDLTLEFDFLDQDTMPLPDPIIPRPYFSNKSYAGAVAYHIRYDDPSMFFRHPLETNFSLSRSWADYAAPDPCCGVASNRLDRRWRFGIAQTFPVTADVVVVLQLQRDIVSSNVPLYHYTNNSVLLGSQVRF
jgi:tetratricopeptide (TPR) repeat protein